MTPYQYRLYRYMLAHFYRFSTGGAAWTGVRGTSTGLAAPTYASLSSRTIRFMEWNRVVERSSLPQIPIYTAPWWGLAAIGVDVQPGDIYTNGTIAFSVTGLPDTSQGFQVIPAASIPLIEVPSVGTPGTGTGKSMGLLLSLTYPSA